MRSALLAAVALYADLRNDEPPLAPVDRMPDALLDYINESESRSNSGIDRPLRRSDG